MIEPDTPTQILDVAERLVQQRGYTGFSYADVAAELGITRAALHYHFDSKADLGVALVERYAARFADALATVDAGTGDARVKLRSYARLYGDVVQRDRMCLCGMLAAGYATLPGQIRERVVGFFDDNEGWLERVLDEGQAVGTLRFEGPSRPIARTLVGGLEGAMLVSRTYGDARRFRDAANLLINGLVVERSG